MYVQLHTKQNVYNLVLSVPVPWSCGGRPPRILNLGTTWRRVASFTLRRLYTQGVSLWCPLEFEPQDRMVGHLLRIGPRSSSPYPVTDSVVKLPLCGRTKSYIYKGHHHHLCILHGLGPFTGRSGFKSGVVRVRPAYFILS
jgi:hypothetical protein